MRKLYNSFCILFTLDSFVLTFLINDCLKSIIGSFARNWFQKDKNFHIILTIKFKIWSFIWQAKSFRNLDILIFKEKHALFLPRNEAVNRAFVMNSSFYIFLEEFVTFIPLDLNFMSISNIFFSPQNLWERLEKGWDTYPKQIRCLD